MPKLERGTELIDFVCDGPPGPEAGRFVEVEDSEGKSVRLGEWLEREDGYWVLRFVVDSSIVRRNIEMFEVRASNITHLGYDTVHRQLAVQFKDGALYHYLDVPLDIFTQLRDARSIGGYLAAGVKGQYRYNRIEP